MRILWCIPGFPFDPTGGGNRSLRTMCEMLASVGHEVHCVGTMQTYHTGVPAGLEVHRMGGGVAQAIFRNVHYAIAKEHRFETVYRMELAGFKPDIVLTYGGNPQDFQKQELAKVHGAKIIFGLRNGLYRDKNFFRLCDAIVTPSKWMSDWYKRTMNLDTTPLPLPVNTEDCTLTEQQREEQLDEPVVTFVNPSHEKGEQLVRAIAAALPDVCFKIVQSRGREKAGWTDNCVFKGPYANPRDIYDDTTILLVPSLWEEPGGRVVCEAMLNGIPPIVSDRGALPEVLNAGGLIAPVRRMFDHSPVSETELAPWIKAIQFLMDRDERLSITPEFIRTRGVRYDSVVLTPLYTEFFESVLNGVPA